MIFGFCDIGNRIAFYEEPGATHRVSRNASKTAPAKLLAVFVVDSGDTTLTTPAE